jgi:lipopolysaccharide/colanic/teichoic acid biosynthesis glycosyltransferase
VNREETRQERREKRLKKKKERITKHGKNLAKVYMDAILKRLKGKERGK